MKLTSFGMLLPNLRAWGRRSIIFSNRNDDARGARPRLLADT